MVSLLLSPLSPWLLSLHRFRPDGSVQREGDRGEARERFTELLCPLGLLPSGAEDRVSGHPSFQTCPGCLESRPWLHPECSAGLPPPESPRKPPRDDTTQPLTWKLSLSLSIPAAMAFIGSLALLQISPHRLGASPSSTRVVLCQHVEQQTFAVTGPNLRDTAGRAPPSATWLLWPVRTHFQHRLGAWPCAGARVALCLRDVALFPCAEPPCLATLWGGL